MRHGGQRLRERREASPGIDVLSVHDYYGAAPLGGDQWNGLAVRFAQAKALDKPIITGEAGIVAGNGQSGCVSLQQRSVDMAAKMTAQFAAWRQRIPGMGLAARPAGTVQLQHRSERQLPSAHRDVDDRPVNWLRLARRQASTNERLT